jgi:hypothetical protein
MQAWERGAKGVTTFRVGGLRAGILNETDNEETVEEEEEVSSCGIDTVTGRRECS